MIVYIGPPTVAVGVVLFLVVQTSHVGSNDKKELDLAKTLTVSLPLKPPIKKGTMLSVQSRDMSVMREHDILVCFLVDILASYYVSLGLSLSYDFIIYFLC